MAENGTSQWVIGFFGAGKTILNEMDLSLRASARYEENGLCIYSGGEIGFNLGLEIGLNPKIQHHGKPPRIEDPSHGGPFAQSQRLISGGS